MPNLLKEKLINIQLIVFKERLMKRCHSETLKVCGLEKDESEFYQRVRKSGKLYLDAICKNCRNAASNKNYHENKKEKSEKSKQYYEKNRDVIKARAKKYRAEHKEQYAAYDKEYEKLNHERQKEYRKQYYEKNKKEISIKTKIYTEKKCR